MTVVLGLSAPQLPAVAHEPVELTMRWDVPAWPGWAGGLELIVDGHEVVSEDGLAAATGMGEALTLTVSGDVGAPAPERTVGLCPGQQRGAVLKLSGVARGSHVAVSYSHASHGHRVEADGVDLVVRLCERL
ncbi:MAG: hypothetical protein KY457_02805 [Actinobacteria bacterium]|nr:hypothetical protein [Actinomycetota bacterium]